MRRSLTFIFGAVAIVVLGLSADPAAAQAPSPSQSTTASLTLNADPSFGENIPVTATYASMKWIPEVSIACSRSGQDVYLDVQTGKGSGSPWTVNFTLWSQTWANNGGGSATCIGNLYYYTWQGKTETGVVYLAQTSFVTT